MNGYDNSVPFVNYKALESLLIEDEEIATEASTNTQYKGFIKYNVPAFVSKLVKEYVLRKDIKELFAITAFGEILAYSSDDHIYKISFEDNSCKDIGFKKFTFNLKDPVYLNDYFDMKAYEYAIKHLGKLKSNECYGYQPLRSIGGGDYDLAKVNLETYLWVCININGPIN